MNYLLDYVKLRRELNRREMLWCSVFLAFVVCLITVVWLVTEGNVLVRAVLFPLFIMGIQRGFKEIHRVFMVKMEMLVSQQPRTPKGR